jgi:hypothetical protein
MRARVRLIIRRKQLTKKQILSRGRLSTILFLFWSVEMVVIEGLLYIPTSSRMKENSESFVPSFSFRQRISYIRGKCFAETKYQDPSSYLQHVYLFIVYLKVLLLAQTT